MHSISKTKSKEKNSFAGKYQIQNKILDLVQFTVTYSRINHYQQQQLRNVKAASERTSEREYRRAIIIYNSQYSII